MVHILKIRWKMGTSKHNGLGYILNRENCSLASIPLYCVHSWHTFLPGKKRDYQSLGWPSPDECLKLRWVELTAIVSTWLAVSSKNIEWVSFMWPSSWNFLTHEPQGPQLTPAMSSVSLVVEESPFCYCGQQGMAIATHGLDGLGPHKEW